MRGAELWSQRLAGPGTGLERMVLCLRWVQHLPVAKAGRFANSMIGVQTISLGAAMTACLMTFPLDG